MNFREDKDEQKCYKRFNNGFADEADSRFRHSAFVWYAVSAVLQYDGHDHCRKVSGCQRLASVGATGSINFMIIGFCMGVCNGFAIPVAQRFGARDEHGMRSSLPTVSGCPSYLQWLWLYWSVFSVARSLN